MYFWDGHSNHLEVCHDYTIIYMNICCGVLGANEHIIFTGNHIWTGQDKHCDCTSCFKVIWFHLTLFLSYLSSFWVILMMHRWAQVIQFHRKWHIYLWHMTTYWWHFGDIKKFFDRLLLGPNPLFGNMYSYCLPQRKLSLEKNTTCPRKWI